MRINLKNRRGLSNVVTSAIMLTFVAVLGTTLVTWSHGNLSSFEQSLASTTSTVTNQINENFVIENLGFFNKVNTHMSSPPKGINATVTNLGLEGITVTQVQINGTDVTTNSYTTLSGTVFGPSLKTSPLRLLPSQSGTIMINQNWHSNSQTTVTVTTTRGTIITAQGVAK